MTAAVRAERLIFIRTGRWDRLIFIRTGRRYGIFSDGCVNVFCIRAVFSGKGDSAEGIFYPFTDLDIRGEDNMEFYKRMRASMFIVIMLCMMCVSTVLAREEKSADAADAVRTADLSAGRLSRNGFPQDVRPNLQDDLFQNHEA